MKTKTYFIMLWHVLKYKHGAEFFKENWIWHFMQIISILHEMSNTVPHHPHAPPPLKKKKKKKKKIKMPSAKVFTQHAWREMYICISLTHASYKINNSI